MDNIDDHILVDLVSQFPILYDKQNKDFKDKIKRENSWKTIAETLGVEVTVAQNRWTVLRTKYGVEKKKEKNIPSGSAPKKPWVLLDVMSFLEKHIVQRKTSGNMKVTDSPIASSSSSFSPWCSMDSIIGADQPDHDVPLDEEIEETEISVEITENDVSNKENVEDSNSSQFSTQTKRKIASEKNATPTLIKKRKKSEDSDLMLKLSSTFDKFTTFMEKKSNVVDADHETQATWDFIKSIGNDLLQIKNKRIRYRAQINIMEVVKTALCDDDIENS